MSVEMMDGGAGRRRPVLSEAGLARRAAMLGELQAALVLRRRRRTTGRRMVLAAIATFAVAGILHGPRGGIPRPAGPAEIARPEKADPPLVLENARLETVRDEPSILGRIVVADRPIPSSAFIDDEGLVSSLGEADRPMGIIRFAGSIILAYHP